MDPNNKDYPQAGELWRYGQGLSFRKLPFVKAYLVSPKNATLTPTDDLNIFDVPQHSFTLKHSFYVAENDIVMFLGTSSRTQDQFTYRSKSKDTYHYFQVLFHEKIGIVLLTLDEWHQFFDKVS